MGLIDYVFYIAGIIAVSRFCFHFGQWLVDAVFWAFKDTRHCWRNAEIMDGFSKFNWLWILPKIFIKVFFQTIYKRANGIIRVG